METHFFSSLCHDATPGFLQLFDLSIAPPLLYYSYIPIITAAGLIGFYIFYKDKYSLKGSLLLLLVLFFILWVLNILVQWVGVYNSVIMFSWQMTALFEVGLFLLTGYFAKVFLTDRDISFTEKVALAIVGVIILIAIPTKFNIVSYDIENCEGVNGVLWHFIYYVLEPVVICSIVWWGVGAYHRAQTKLARQQASFFTLGAVFFLGVFYISNLYGELTKVYEFNLWGPLGMLVFLVILGYMIVQYRAFNIKFLATEALVIGITFLTGARLFYSTTLSGLLISAVTFVLFVIGGVFLIRSVRREVSQREELERLAGVLEEANMHQTALIHFIAHQVKGFLTKSKYIFGELDSGTYGTLAPKVKDIVQQGLHFNSDGVNMVQNVLRAANLKTGKVVYEKAPVDMKEVVTHEVAEQSKVAKEKGLTLTTEIEDGAYMLTGDYEQLSHAVQNLIDNAIKYTLKGSVTVSLKHVDATIQLAVKDSGIGIPESDREHIFTEGGRGEESAKINVDSTGYGLYLVKGIVEAHGGKVWYESEGKGTGSTFFVEVPVG